MRARRAVRPSFPRCPSARPGARKTTPVRWTDWWKPPGRVVAAVLLGLLASVALGAREPVRAADFAPSFNCAKATDPTAPIICGDRFLSWLDVQMAAVYARAVTEASASARTEIKAAQRAWWSHRQDCLLQGDIKACIGDRFIERTAELQAILLLARNPAPSPIDEKAYAAHLATIDSLLLQGSYADSLKPSLDRELNSEAVKRSSPLQFELLFRGAIWRLGQGNCSLAAENLQRASRVRDGAAGPVQTNQVKRWNLLASAVNACKGDESRGIFQEYCAQSPGQCDWADHGNRERTISTALRLGFPPSALRKALYAETLRDVRATAATERLNMTIAEAQARTAAAAEAARIQAEQEAKRQRLAAEEAAEEQRRRDEQERIQTARDAAEKAAADEAERQRRDTLGYRIRSLGEVVTGSFAAIAKHVPLWTYVAALALGLFLHRDRRLRVAGTIALFTHLAVFAAAYVPWKNPLSALAGIPGAYLAFPALLAEALDPQTDIGRRAISLAYCYVPLSLVIYAATLTLVGAGARRAEWDRLRQLVSSPVLSLRTPRAWTEWRHRRRLIREAKLEATLNRIRQGHPMPAAHGAYPYGYPPPPGAARGLLGLVRDVFSFAKVVVIAGTVLVLVIYAAGFMDKANALLTKAQEFQPTALTEILSIFK